MAEEWNPEDEAPAPKKGGIPRWLWIGCGAGCLLTLLVGTIAGVAIFAFAKDFADPDVAWEEVGEVLPFDQRPEGWDAKGKMIPFIGQGQYFLQPPGFDGIVILWRFKRKADLEPLFDPESVQNKGVFGVGAIRDAETGTIEIQGREARCLRFEAWVPESAQEEGVAGVSLRLDLTGESGPPTALQMTRGDGEEPFSDAEIEDLLAPFDVWRNR